QIPQLRAVLLFRFIPREVPGGGFTCLVLLYRLNDQREVYVDDVVSFGSAPLNAATDDALTGIQTPLRVLPLAPVRTEGVRVLENPWDVQDRAFVQIPAADIFSDA
ncbi:hypothetical protein JG688_00009512, partial [Phytophthora aleatoria]